MDNQQEIPRIVIVGGGAGGLELAAKLGKKLGKRGKAQIRLIDASPTHLWKPLLHEVAAGTLNSNEDEVNYRAYASTHHSQFSLGHLQGLNRTRKTITLAPILNAQQQEIIPQRFIPYDVLVIAVGSVANDFGTPGVREHCMFLDSRSEADYFQKILSENMLRLAYEKSHHQQSTPFSIALIGGGATGVELAAELKYAIEQMTQCGLAIDPNDISINVIEAADRVVPMLPNRISDLVLKELQRLSIRVYTGKRVTAVTETAVKIESNELIPANLKVWTAGIKAPDVLRDLDGLEVNRLNQLILKPTLQTTLDPSIFALGDCGYCPQPNPDKPVPPRAQAAHQQANFLVQALQDYLNNKKPLRAYRYKDYGSLISLGQYTTIGNLMSRISKNMLIEGKFARFAYWSLYRMHLTALYGAWRVILLTIANRLSRKVRPRLKLH